MAIDEINVDFLSLDDFRRRLDRRLDEARSVLAALRTGPGTEPAELGGFQDAVDTAARHTALRDEFAGRVDRLVSALTAARAGAETALGTYRETEDRNDADTRAIRARLSSGG